MTMSRHKIKSKQGQIDGATLVANAATGERYVKSIQRIMRAMHKETLNGIQRCFEAYAQDSDLPEKGSLVSQLRILLNALLKKYHPLFAWIAKKATEKMISETLKHSSATLKMSLKEISKDLVVNPDFMDDRLKEITQASVLEATSLIKTLPQKYIGDVQKVVMHNISIEGKGFAEVKPFLQKLYHGNERKAQLVAMDQTRKVYNSIQSHKLQKMGVKKFKWIHSGGGREPRKLHQALHGQVFSFDDPPFIGEMYGEKVYGLPGHLPNCACSFKPVFDFEEENSDQH